MVGLHKDRYVFPIRIAVTKVSGSGAARANCGLLSVSRMLHALWSQPTLPRQPCV